MEPEETAAVRKRLDKHASAAMNMHATTEELLEAVSSMRSVRSYIAWLKLGGGQTCDRSND